MPYTYQGWTLYSRDVKLKKGPKVTIYFFSKRKPKSGKPMDEMPKNRKIGVNKRTGLPFLRKGWVQPREPHPPRQNGGGPRPLSLLTCSSRIELRRGRPERNDCNPRPAKYFPGVALPGTRCRKGRFHSRSRLPSSACGRSSATCGRSEAASPVCSPWRSSMTNAPGGICKSRSDRSPKTSRSSRRRRTRFL